MFYDSLYSFFLSLSFMTLRVKDFVYVSIYFTFLHVSSLFVKNALNNDSTCSKCISAYFCIHTFYNHILDTFNIDALCNLNCKTVWSLCWSHDIFSHWSAYSSSQRWLYISSVKYISFAHSSLWVTQSSWLSFLNVCLCWS